MFQHMVVSQGVVTGRIVKKPEAATTMYPATTQMLPANGSTSSSEVLSVQRTSHPFHAGLSHIGYPLNQRLPVLYEAPSRSPH